MITLYNTNSSQFETCKKNANALCNIIAMRNKGNYDSREMLIEILRMIQEETRTGISSEVALTLLENDSRFREGQLFCSRKQAWSIAWGATQLGLNLSTELARSAMPAVESPTIANKDAKTEKNKKDFVNGVRLGDTIELADTETGCLMSFRIVRKASHSSEAQELSCSSPVGEAVLGHVTGLVEVNTPSGLKKFQLLSITRP